MPPGYEPFLRAICANPADDTVRLAFADWLDENGDPERAEFIRCQIEAERTGNRKGDAHRRAQKLRHSHWRKWVRELPRLPDAGWGDFRRGFVAGVDLSGERAADTLATACALTPIQEVRVYRSSPELLAGLCCSPFLKHITAIDAPSGTADDDGVRALAESPAVALEWLTLSGAWWVNSPAGSYYEPRITDRGLLALCRSPNLARLQHLTLYTAHLSDAACAEAVRRFASFVCHTRQPPP
jgi:uncharacterized protein (TIGR02996 family)